MKALIDTRLGARFCLWKTDRQSADVSSLRGFVMDLPTLQNYLREERRPLCIMDEGGRGDQPFHVRQQRDELIWKREKKLVPL